MKVITTTENPDANALTEVALALAMAFFSVMVLAMLSIGLPSSSQEDHAVDQVLSVSSNGDGGPKPIPSDVQFFAYFNGAYVNAELKPVSAEALPVGSVVAVPETLSVSEVLALQSELSRSNPVITTLNAEWLSLLEQNIE